MDSSGLALCEKKAAHLLISCCALQVVAGAGAIDHTHLVDLAGKSFASLPTNPTTADDLVKKVSQGWVPTHSCRCGYSIGIVLGQSALRTTLQNAAAASMSFPVHLQDSSVIMHALPAFVTACHIVSIFP